MRTQIVNSLGNITRPVLRAWKHTGSGQAELWVCHLWLLIQAKVIYLQNGGRFSCSFCFDDNWPPMNPFKVKILLNSADAIEAKGAFIIENIAPKY